MLIISFDFFSFCLTASIPPYEVYYYIKNKHLKKLEGRIITYMVYGFNFFNKIRSVFDVDLSSLPQSVSSNQQILTLHKNEVFH